MGSCDFCKVEPEEPLKSCVCRKVSYCSKECQAKDWKTHKPSCPPFIIRESPGKGRGLFATRRIQNGKSILMVDAATVAELSQIVSLINHSCVPNATYGSVMEDCTRRHFRALRTIENREEILVSYLPDGEFVSGSREFRRQQLLEKRGFLCECSECSLEGEALEKSDRKRAELKEQPWFVSGLQKQKLERQ